MQTYSAIEKESTTGSDGRPSHDVPALNQSFRTRPGLALFRQPKELPQVVQKHLIPKGQQIGQPRDIPMRFPDGKLYKYRFDSEYFLACDYDVKEVEEEQKNVKEESNAINQRFQKYISGVMANIRQKARTPEGLAEITAQNFNEYCDKLHSEYTRVGFNSRDKTLAKMQISTNLMKLNNSDAKFSAYFQEVLNQQKEARRVWENFLTVEPWETKIKSLKDATFQMDNDTTAAEIGSFLISVQNGDVDSPSFHIDLSLFASMKTGTTKMLERFVTWAKSGTARAYELKLTVNKTSNGYIGSARLKKFFSDYFQNLGVELFTLHGTDKITDEHYCGQVLIATTILECLAESEHLRLLQRFSMSECCVDATTLRALADIARNCELSAIKLSKLQPSLKIPDEPRNLKMAQRSVECNDIVKQCSVGNCCWCFDCGWCSICATAPDFHKTRVDLDKYITAFRKKYGSIKDGDDKTGGELLSELFKNMNPKGQLGKLDVVDMTGTDLIDLCGSVAEVNKMLSGLAEAKPIAVNLANTGLLEQNISEICNLFFENPDLSHLALTLTVSDVAALENLQNLVQNSPRLISGRIDMGLPRQALVAGQIEDIAVETSFCCFSFKEVQVKQKTHQLQFPGPRQSLGKKDFEIYNSTISKEMDEHLIMPMFKVLQHRFKDNPDKLKNLHRASLDSVYKSVISPEADEKKMKLMWAFRHEVLKGVGVDDEMMKYLQQGNGTKSIANGNPNSAPANLMITSGNQTIAVEVGQPSQVGQSSQPESQQVAPADSTPPEPIRKRNSIGNFFRSSVMGGR